MFTLSIALVSAFKSQNSMHTHNESLFTAYQLANSDMGDVVVSCMGDVISSVSDVIIHACILITIIYGLLSCQRDSIGFFIITIINYS